MSKRFTRTVEDFTCEHCQATVVGNGYTNHCQQCLWSKHVDINPGDRAETCGGLMEPIAILRKGTEYSIQHQCTRCGFQRFNRTTPEDNFEMVLELVRSGGLT